MNKIAQILKKSVFRTLAAIVLGLFVAGIILAVAGYPPLRSMLALGKGIFSSPKYVSNVLIKSTPIIFTGLSVAFAFKTGLFNIGVEGQFIVGCLASTLVGITLDLPPVIQVPLVLLAGLVAGAAYGGMIGVLKAKFGIHEVISGIMLNWIALYLSNYICILEPFRKGDSNGTYQVSEASKTLILGAWKNTDDGRNFLKGIPILGEAFLKTDVNIGFLAAVIMAILLAVLLKKTTKGFELRAVGYNKYSAEAVGIDIKKNIIDVMLISGAVAGLGAALYITGNTPHKITVLSAFEGMGINGLPVALIAGSSPVGCILSGLLFGGLMYGGQALQYEVGAPTEIINIVIGIIVFFVAIMKGVPRLLLKIPRRGGKHVK
ncbi:ABC transporter permease [Anaerosacchariphilus polymeriproducens]|uniref:ABC transporter permease n=2 Tax=Anaerosacchariphilus polymeriproducens TaxID=1812858 RepID=A0A371AT12_9FIRM|nr:ABC transporter permease [Anaerosacchariphilus polymeriproducens]